MTFQDESSLADELAEALEQMVDTTCLDMLPLYVQATKPAAKRHLESTSALGHVSPRVLKMSRSSRTKYGVLAAFRHAVIWTGVLDDVDPDFGRAVRDLYFTPYPRNRAPYAWTARSSECPAAGRWQEGPNHLDRMAKEGCWAAICLLRGIVAEGGDAMQQARADFVACALKKTAKDVLRLEEQWDG